MMKCHLDHPTWCTCLYGAGSFIVLFPLFLMLFGVIHT